MFVHTYFAKTYFTDGYFPGPDPFGGGGTNHFVGMIRNAGTMLGRR